MIELHEPAVSAPPTPREARRGRSWLTIALEITLISVGVFLGLMAEQWRERAQKRELAEASLQRFRSEFVTNRKAVQAVRDKHTNDVKAIHRYLQSDAATRAQMPYPFNGTNPAFLEYAAWEVALATQSLAYIDSDLAHRIAHVYAVQRQLDGATRDITHVMYSKTSYPDPIGFLTSMVVYFGDCNLIEPRLIALYDEIIPEVERTLRGRVVAR